MTTNRPTPAKDRAEAAEAALTVKVDDFVAQFENLSRDEAVTQARLAAPYAKASKIASKTAAVRILARKAYNESPEVAALKDLQRAELKEGAIYDAIDRSQGRVSGLQKMLTDMVSNVWETERMMDTVASLRTEARLMSNWTQVEEAINNGHEPLEALALYREHLSVRFLSPFSHRATSKSTSVTRNLCSEIDVEADAMWLHDTKSYL